MTITVNERYLHGKHGGDETLDEDGIFVGHTFAAVVDGVTSKSRMNPWNPSPGVVAKNTVIETIAAMDVETDTGVSEETFLHEDPEQADANEETWGMRAMQRRIDKALRARYRTHPTHNEDYFATHPLERLQANAVVYSSETHEIWLFGDCQAMINGQRIPTTKKTDELLSALRSFVWQAQELEHNSTEHTTANSGKPNTERPGTDPSRDAIMPFLRMQSAFANKRGEYGYFVFDGYTDPPIPHTRTARRPRRRHRTRQRRLPIPRTHPQPIRNGARGSQGQRPASREPFPLDQGLRTGARLLRRPLLPASHRLTPGQWRWRRRGGVAASTPVRPDAPTCAAYPPMLLVVLL